LSSQLGHFYLDFDLAVAADEILEIEWLLQMLNLEVCGNHPIYGYSFGSVNAD
jgi:hypothetical protein